MSSVTDLPSEERARALLRVIAPASRLAAIRPIADDHHNETYIVEATRADDTPIRVVVKRYVDNSHVVARARLEFDALVWLRRSGIPVPEPVYLDDTGALLGSPGIVTRFVPGQQLRPSDHPSGSDVWVHEMAHTLTRIHSMPLDDAAREVLLAGRVEGSDTLWFIHSGVMPDYLTAHPLGETVWNTISERRPNLAPVQPTLTHTDYWPGNLLWSEGQDCRIVAVLDWEEAAYDNPIADVAYCRMDLFLTGHRAAADEFLRVYEEAMGAPAMDLGFWQLAAAVRPLFRPDGWITGSPAQERFQDFVQDALER